MIERHPVAAVHHDRTPKGIDPQPLTE